MRPQLYLTHPYYQDHNFYMSLASHAVQLHLALLLLIRVPSTHSEDFNWVTQCPSECRCDVQQVKHEDSPSLPSYDYQSFGSVKHPQSSKHSTINRPLDEFLFPSKSNRHNSTNNDRLTNTAVKVEEKIVDCQRLSSDSTLHLASQIAAFPVDVNVINLRHTGLISIGFLGKFRELRRLNVANNNLTTLLAYESYTVFLQMLSLDLRRNQFRTLSREEFISFPNLRHLDLSDNSIAVIHEETFRLINLQNLNLAGNRITTISQRMFRYSPHVLDLDLSRNRLDRVQNRNFYYLINVQQLNLSRNAIVTIEADAFHPIRSLHTIDLSWNLVKSFPNTQLISQPALHTFCFDGNLVEVFETGCIGYLSVHVLSLSHLSRLKLIAGAAITHLPNLHTLRLANNNQLAYISGVVTHAGDKQFSGCPLLSQVHLSGGNLRGIDSNLFADLKGLTQVSLGGNPFICACVDQHNGLFSQLQCGSSSSSCQPQLISNYFYPHSSSVAHLRSGSKSKLETSVIQVEIGSRLKIYCVSPSIRLRNVTWYYASTDTHYNIRREYLELPSASLSDSGVVFCSTDNSLHFDELSKNSNQISNSPESSSKTIAFTVSVIYPAISFGVIYTSDRYVVVQWNQSDSFTGRLENFQILLNRFDSSSLSESENLGGSNLLSSRSVPDDTGWSYGRLKFPQSVTLRNTYQTHRFTGLAANTSYLICLVYHRFRQSPAARYYSERSNLPLSSSGYRRVTSPVPASQEERGAQMDVVLPASQKPASTVLSDSCVELRTLEYPDVPGQSGQYTVDYISLGVLGTIGGFLLVICLGRCAYRRLHIWQQERLHATLQETLSARGMFSSLESIHSSSITAHGVGGTRSGHRGAYPKHANGTANGPSSSCSSTSRRDSHGYMAYSARSSMYYRSPRSETEPIVALINGSASKACNGHALNGTIPNGTSTTSKKGHHTSDKNNNSIVHMNGSVIGRARLDSGDVSSRLEDNEETLALVESPGTWNDEPQPSTSGLQSFELVTHNGSLKAHDKSLLRINKVV